MPTPGGYPDPSGEPGQRHGDGQHWSGQTRPRTDTEPAGKKQWLAVGGIAALALLLWIGIGIGSYSTNTHPTDTSAKTGDDASGPPPVAPIPPSLTLAPPPAGTAPPARITGAGGQTWASSDSSCTSGTAAAPIDLQTTRVKVGEMPGRPGTRARVTLTYTGQMPDDATVLLSLLATNSDHQRVHLAYRTGGGENAASFWFPSGAGTRHDIDDFAHIRTPGKSKVVMHMPTDALAYLGPVWSWESVISVDGVDVDGC